MNLPATQPPNLNCDTTYLDCTASTSLFDKEAKSILAMLQETKITLNTPFLCPYHHLQDSVINVTKTT